MDVYQMANKATETRVPMKILAMQKRIDRAQGGKLAWEWMYLRAG